MEEKLKKALECCISCKCMECPMFPELNCDGILLAETEKYIAEMDEQKKRNEPMKPTLNESHSYVSDAFKCGKCGHAIRFHAKYCEDCGQAVRWSE